MFTDGIGKKSEMVTAKIKWGCEWKKCPDVVYWRRKYSVDEKNPKVATKINGNDYCTIIRSTHHPSDKVSSWGIKILKLEYGGGNVI